VRAVNRTRKTVIGERIAVAGTALARAKGLLGTGMLPAGEGLWIFPCRSIHSFGMRYEFDALFVGPDGMVVGICRSFRVNRVSRFFRTAAGVLELPAGTIDRTSTAVGDRIELRQGGFAG